MRGSRARRPFLAIFLFSATLSIAIITGYFFFARMIASLPKNAPPSDAIVTFTGETYRIHAALKLLRTGAGKRLLITGVHHRTREEDFIFFPYLTFLKCCIDIDRTAKDTVGNAIAMVEWARKKNYRSLLLVTSRYHLPRAMTEINRLNSSLHVIPYPADPHDRTKRETLDLFMFTEYLKFLGAKLRAEIESLFNRFKEKHA